MQNAVIKLVVSFFLTGMLLVSCATTSSNAPEEQAPVPSPPTEAVALEEISAADQEARRQYEIERNRFMYEDIFFEKNKYGLDDPARENLNWKAAWLQENPQVKVIIEGHCGEGGQAENNMALGLRRAGEVKGFLLRKGIARDRLTAVSYGCERPIAEGEGEEVQAKNRRVRLTIIAE
ncbi:MAG: OmpA family protein [Desulfosarcina sp.]|nr:OmpA family protein [Desulfobacterales bacterium]